MAVYSATTDSNFGTKTGHVTIPPTPPDRYNTYKNFSKGEVVTFQGKIGKIEEIGENGMTAFVQGEGSGVPVDINTVKLYGTGGKSRRKSRKSRKSRKTRSYRRV